MKKTFSKKNVKNTNLFPSFTAKFSEVIDSDSPRSQKNIKGHLQAKLFDKKYDRMTEP